MSRRLESRWVQGLIGLTVVSGLLVVGMIEEREASPDGWKASDLPRELGWAHLDLGAVQVSSVSNAYFDGDMILAGRAFDDAAARVLDGEEPVPLGDPPIDPGKGTAQVVGDAVVSVVTVTDEHGGIPRRMWVGDSSWMVPLELPEAEGELDSLAIATNEEDAYVGAVGVVTGPDGPGLMGWRLGSSWKTLEDHPLPLVAEPKASDVAPGVVAAATESTLYAALNADDGVEIWGRGAYRRDGGDWHQVALDAGIDRVTGAAWWDLGVWLMGHDGFSPRAFELAGGRRGRALDLPDIRLDPEHPEVEMISAPVVHSAVLALQTVDGPEVWIDGPEGWVGYPAPVGKLTGGTVVEDVVYLVIDGQLFKGRLPADQFVEENIGSAP